MKTGIAADFQALSTTISSIYDLRGIGVSAVYVCRDMWEWMQEQNGQNVKKRNLITGAIYTDADQDFVHANVEFHTAKSGAIAATMKPYGANRKIPVEVKYSGDNPWKVVVGYKKEDV